MDYGRERVSLNPIFTFREEGICRKMSVSRVYLSRHVCFDPLALLLDASLEGELDLVRKTASLVQDPSAANDEGITALHNAICAGHFDIVRFLVQFGCDVNAQVRRILFAISVKAKEAAGTSSKMQSLIAVLGL